MNTDCTLRIALLAVILLCTTAVDAQRTGEKYDLLIKTGNHLPQTNLDQFITTPVDGAEVVQGRYYRIIQFYDIPKQQEKEQLQATGLHFINYLPNYSYITSIPKNYDRTQLQNANVRSVLAYQPAFKLVPRLVDQDYPEWALIDKETIELIVNHFEDLDRTSVIAMVQQAGFEVSHTEAYINSFNVIMEVDRINELASLPMISYIEPIEPPSEPENLVNRTDHRSHAIANEYSAGRHYTGYGMNVMMQDDGIIGPHIDYTGRLDQSAVSSNNGNHGDHVAGTIMGAGNLDPLTRGMAFGAKLFVYSSANSNYNFVPSLYTNDTVRITSKSYSNGCNAGYTTLTQQLDQQVRQNNKLIHVFSAGNSGTSNCSYGAGAGWGNITGGHKMGKNTVTCANLDYEDNLATSSSRGPAHDGRVKPDISGVGTSVYSTIDVNTYGYKTGTSMSCPGVAGTITQLYDCYKQNNSNNVPEAALIKCAVLNGCDDIGNVGVDYKHGWGRINGLRAARMIENNQYISSTITQSATNNHQITAPSGLAQIKVMVLWSDYEAAVSASVALINDLNMVVTDPNSSSWNPWILDPTPNSTTLNFPATRGVDDLNNMEQFTLNNPPSGTYNIAINGFQVPQGPQKYWITYEFITNDVEVAYPVGGEGFVTGETETIRWDAFSNTGTFDIDYSPDNGSSWNTVANNVNGSNRSYDWTVANELTGEVLIRVERSIYSDQSDETFSIIGVPANIQIPWACPDSLELTWSAVSGATGYEIRMLGNVYMDSIGFTTATNFIVTGISSNNTYWFSVRAYGPFGAEGRRAIAVEKPPGIINCYSCTLGNSIPYYEDFETWPLCSEDYFCENISCAAQNGWSNEPNQLVDDHDWRTDQGGTPSNNTGPSIDFDPGTSTGNYLYTEASNGCWLKTGNLVSPCIDMLSAVQPELSFAYHMYGANMGSLHLDIYYNNAWVNDIMTAISGQQSNNSIDWQTATVDLSPYIGDVIRLRFRGITGGDYDSDMAIDGIGIDELFVDVPENDVASNIRVYPNPGSGIYQLNIRNSKAQDVKIRVTDMRGSVITPEKNLGIVHSFTGQIDLTGRAAGIYYVHFQIGDKTYHERIALQ